MRKFEAFACVSVICFGVLKISLIIISTIMFSSFFLFKNNSINFFLLYKLLFLHSHLLTTVFEGIRKRKNNFTNSTNHNTATKMIGFDVEPGDEVLSDKSKDGYQKVVRINSDGNCFVTAGTEGIIRCWDVSVCCFIFHCCSLEIFNYSSSHCCSLQGLNESFSHCCFSKNLNGSDLHSCL